MKKVEIETGCGETSTIYVSQDVAKITVDGKEYTLSSPDEKQEEKVKTGTVLTLGDRKGGDGYTISVLEGHIITSDRGSYMEGVYLVLDPQGKHVAIIDTNHFGEFRLS